MRIALLLLILVATAGAQELLTAPKGFRPFWAKRDGSGLLIERRANLSDGRPARKTILASSTPDANGFEWILFPRTKGVLPFVHPDPADPKHRADLKVIKGTSYLVASVVPGWQARQASRVEEAQMLDAYLKKFRMDLALQAIISDAELPAAVQTKLRNEATKRRDAAKARGDSMKAKLGY